jgi:hypothetical protein
MTGIASPNHHPQKPHRCRFPAAGEPAAASGLRRREPAARALVGVAHFDEPRWPTRSSTSSHGKPLGQAGLLKVSSRHTEPVWRRSTGSTRGRRRPRGLNLGQPPRAVWLEALANLTNLAPWPRSAKLRGEFPNNKVFQKAVEDVFAATSDVERRVWRRRPRGRSGPAGHRSRCSSRRSPVAVLLVRGDPRQQSHCHYLFEAAARRLGRSRSIS